MKNKTKARFLFFLITGLAFSLSAFAERQVECYPDRHPKICVGDLVQNLYLGGDAIVVAITSRGDFEIRQIRGPYLGSQGRGYYLQYLRLLQRGQRAQPQPASHTPAKPRPEPVKPEPVRPEPPKQPVKSKPATQPVAPKPQPKPQPKPEVKPQPAKPKAKAETPVPVKPQAPKPSAASDTEPLPPLPDSGVVVDLPNVN